MDIVKESLKRGIDRAEQFLQSNAADARGLTIHRDWLLDVVTLLEPVVAARGSRQTGFDEADKIADLFEKARLTVNNLQLGLANGAAVENGVRSTAKSEAVLVPPIKLPTFCGQPLEFRQFMDLFSRAVDAKASLGDVEKMVLLKDCLAGEAFDVVDGIPVMAKNYRLALELLEDAYGDKERCIVSLYERLENVPAAATSEAAQLRVTYWKLEAVLRSLERYEVQTTGNAWLRNTYLGKFPKEVHTSVAKDDELALVEMRKRIRRLIRVKEQVDRCTRFEAGAVGTEDGGKEGQSRVSSVVASGQKPSHVKQQTQNSAETHSTNEFEADIEDQSLDGHPEDVCCGPPTGCVYVTYPESGLKTYIRLTLSTGSPTNTLSESAARRLRIKVKNKEETIQCRDIAGQHFGISKESFKIIVECPSGRKVPLNVHIVENVCCHTNVYAPSLAEFRKKHPSFLDDELFLEPGNGIPIEMLVCGDQAILPMSFRSPSRKSDWCLMKTGLGTLVCGPNVNENIVILTFFLA